MVSAAWAKRAISHDFAGVAFSSGALVRLHIANLRGDLSPERLLRYERLSSRAGLPGALALYDWDVRLSGAFFEEIHYLEVVLRNALATRLTDMNGGNSEWFKRSDWFTDKSFSDITDALWRLDKRRKPKTSGHVISELSLGFWRFLTAARYHQLFWQKTNGFHQAFPGLSDALHHRGDVYDIVQELNLLRNRIAHHQSILERDHLADHATIVQLVGWISPDSAMLLTMVGRVPRLVARPPVLSPHGSAPPLRPKASQTL